MEADVRDMETKTTEDLVQGAGIMVNVAFTSYPDGTVVAECTDIPGCISQGESMIEAKANIADAIAACLSVILEDALHTRQPQNSELGQTVFEQFHIAPPHVLDCA